MITLTNRLATTAYEFYYGFTWAWFYFSASFSSYKNSYQIST